MNLLSLSILIGILLSTFILNAQGSHVYSVSQIDSSSALETGMRLLKNTAYLGVMKSNKVNSKAQGTFLIGYNFLSDKTGINSPWIVRSGWKI